MKYILIIAMLSGCTILKRDHGFKATNRYIATYIGYKRMGHGDYELYFKNNKGCIDTIRQGQVWGFKKTIGDKYMLFVDTVSMRAAKPVKL